MYVGANRRGFLALDLKGTEADKWPRLAVVAKAERWPKEALQLVRRHSSKTLELRTGEDSEVERLLLPSIDDLAA